MIRCDPKARRIEEVRGYVFRCYDTEGNLDTLWFRDLASAEAFASLADEHEVYVNKDAGAHAVVEWKASMGVGPVRMEGFAGFMGYRAPHASVAKAEQALKGLMF